MKKTNPQAHLENLLRSYHPGWERLKMVRKSHPLLEDQIDILKCMRDMEIKIAEDRLKRCPKTTVH